MSTSQNYISWINIVTIMTNFYGILWYAFGHTIKHGHYYKVYSCWVDHNLINYSLFHYSTAISHTCRWENKVSTPHDIL